MMEAVFVVLAVLVVLVLVNLVYLAVRTVQDLQARRWGWAAAGGISLLGVIGLLLMIALTLFGFGAVG